MSEAILIYSTFNSYEHAEQAITVLLEKQLIACANIFQEHISMYRWEGKIEKNNEVSVILKSTKPQFLKIKDQISKTHNYECPCILSLEVDQIHTPFYQWLVSELSPAS